MNLTPEQIKCVKEVREKHGIYFYEKFKTDAYQRCINPQMFFDYICVNLNVGKVVINTTCLKKNKL